MNVFPNSSKEDVHIALALPASMETQLFLFDEMGRTTKELPKQQVEQGQYVITIPKNKLDQGFYFIKLIAEDKVITKRIVRSFE